MILNEMENASIICSVVCASFEKDDNGPFFATVCNTHKMKVDDGQK